MTRTPSARLCRERTGHDDLRVSHPHTPESAGPSAAHAGHRAPTAGAAELVLRGTGGRIRLQAELRGPA